MSGRFLRKSNQRGLKLRVFVGILGAAIATLPASCQSPGYIITTVAGGGLLPTPVQATSVPLALTQSSLAADAFGNIYFIAYNCAFKLDGTGVLTRVAGSTTAAVYSGDGGLATSAGFSCLGGIAVDGAGNLYLSDTGNNRIRKVTATGIVSTVAGNGAGGFSGDGGTATSAELHQPGAVAVDSAGNLFIGDVRNFRVREVAAGTGIITTFAGTCASGYSGDGG